MQLRYHRPGTLDIDNVHYLLCSPELPGQHLPALGEAGLLGEMGESVAGLTRDITYT